MSKIEKEMSGEEWNEMRQRQFDASISRSRGQILIYCSACFRVGSQHIPLEPQDHVDFSSCPHKRQHVCRRGLHVEYLLE